MTARISGCQGHGGCPANAYHSPSVLSLGCHPERSEGSAFSSRLGDSYRHHVILKLDPSQNNEPAGIGNRRALLRNARLRHARRQRNPICLRIPRRPVSHHLLVVPGKRFLAMADHAEGQRRKVGEFWRPQAHPVAAVRVVRDKCRCQRQRLMNASASLSISPARPSASPSGSNSANPEAVSAAALDPNFSQRRLVLPVPSDAEGSAIEGRTARVPRQPSAEPTRAQLG
jgi:hypothetical protein